MNKLKIIIFSDIHYLDKRPNKLDFNLSRKLTQYSDFLIDKLIDKINTEKYDIAICLGDLIEDTNNHDKDIINFKHIWNKLKKIKIPFYSVLGNHDLRTMNSRSELERIMDVESNTFSFDFNNYHFIILSTDIRECLNKDDGGISKTHYISNNEIKWLKADIKKNNLPCLIFTHFGIAEDDMKDNYWFSKEPESALLSNRKELKQIINDNNIIGVFSGHQHWTKKIKENNINYYIVGSIVENIKNDNVPDGVYLEVEIIDKKVVVRQNHLEI